MKAVFYQLGQSFTFLALALLAPAVIAAAVDEDFYLADFLIPGLLIGFAGGALMLGLRGGERQLKRSESYALAVLAWFLVPVPAAVPFVTAGGLGPLEAYFEAVSGLTTTGASTLGSEDDLPGSLIFWRAFLQWLGGLATLVTVVVILAESGAGGLPNRHLGFLEHGGASSRRQVSTTLRALLPGYAGVSAVCILFLMLTGVPALDAFCLAFSSVSTGGFMPREGGLESYGSFLAELILVATMLYGATNILWHSMLLGGREDLLRRHRESYWVIGVALAMGLVYAVVFFRVAGGPDGGSVPEALRHGLVTGVSLVTTTGFEPVPGALAALPFPLLALFLALGGASFSTAGGIKFYRFGGMGVQSYRELGRLIYPHSVRSGRFGSQPYDIQLMKAIWSCFAVYAAMALLVALVVAIEHPDFEGALIASMSAIGNNGPVYSSAWGEDGWPDYGDLSAIGQIALAFGMIVGRLEMVAVFSLGLAVIARR